MIKKRTFGTLILIINNSWCLYSPKKKKKRNDENLIASLLCSKLDYT